MADKIELDFDEFRALSPAAQNEILLILTGKRLRRGLPAEAEQAVEVDVESEEGPASLSLNEARKLLFNLGPKSRSFLEYLVANGGRARVSDILKVLKMKRWQDLRGVQAGITNRTRTVTGNPDAYILKWDDDTYDDDDPATYDSAYLYVTQGTCSTLSKVL